MNIREAVKRNQALLISYTAFMVVLVFITTVIFSLYIPQTRGFFNIGETGVYIAAITGGPIVGMIAGGFGSALADIALGYSYYAPVTLIVKGLEGLIVGILSGILPGIFRGRLRVVGGLTGIGLGILIYVIGVSFYTGSADITLGFITTYSITASLSMVIWGFGAIIIVSLLTYLTIYRPEYIGYALSTIIGGIEMILGYFIYQLYVYGPGALAEIPFNIMQMSIGTMIALIVVSSTEKMWKE